jgi:hypothetical protein
VACRGITRSKIVDHRSRASSTAIYIYILYSIYILYPGYGITIPYPSQPPTRADAPPDPRQHPPSPGCFFRSSHMRLHIMAREKTAAVPEPARPAPPHPTSPVLLHTCPVTALPLPIPLRYPAAAAAPHAPPSSCVPLPPSTAPYPLAPCSRRRRPLPHARLLLIQLASGTNTEPLPAAFASASSSPYRWRAP